MAFDEEAKVWLKKTADLQSALLELQQRRRKAGPTFDDASPRMQPLSRQISVMQGEPIALSGPIAGIPNVQRAR